MGLNKDDWYSAWLVLNDMNTLGFSTGALNDKVVAKNSVKTGLGVDVKLIVGLTALYSTDRVAVFTMFENVVPCKPPTLMLPMIVSSMSWISFPLNKKARL